jgi:predicted MFS family arabinose efflux permease
MVMAWYNLWGSFSSAFGALACGAYLSRLRTSFGYSPLESCQVILYIYSFLQGILLCIIFPISTTIEAPSSSQAAQSKNPVSLFLGLHKSKSIVIGLSLLFLIDSFAGSFAMQSVISGWFNDVYGTPPATLGSIVFVCNILAGVSALFAAKLASYIGLVMTMVVTHLPSNVLIALVPVMPTELLAIIVLCARFSISQMDVPTRNAYVQSVVDPDERSGAAGVTNVVRSLGASAGPWLAGMLFANRNYRNYPFFIAGGLKIIYDLLLLWSFNGVVGDENSK